MSKPKLFVGLDGPVLVPASTSSDRDEFLGAAVAPYAKPFIHWAQQHFDVHWLTDRGFPHGTYVSKTLQLPRDAVKTVGFSDSKVEALSPHLDFFWVDAELIPSEVSWVAQHGLLPRVLQVDPIHGVTPDVKQALEAALHQRKR